MVHSVAVLILPPVSKLENEEMLLSILTNYQPHNLASQDGNFSQTNLLCVEVEKDVSSH